jgi:hypothetical protein
MSRMAETTTRADTLVLTAVGVAGAGFAVLALAERGFGMQFPTLDLGRDQFLFLAIYLVSGLLAWPRLAAVVTRSGVERQLVAWLHAGSDGAWIVGGSVAAFVAAALIRTLVFRDLPITDDEYAYLFSARLLASGRIGVPSPALPAFFDHMFMSNDGRMVSQYFLGWPALLAPGVVLGAPGYANAVYGALTAPAIFLVSRRIAGSWWARVSSILYATSPAFMDFAATAMSHTTCLLWLAWCTWAVLRSEDDDAPWWADALVATTFGAAFFVRPASAGGLGFALLVAWALGVWRRPGRRVGRLAAFGVPALALAALFLAANDAITGDPLLTPYGATATYLEAHYRTAFPRTLVFAPADVARVQLAVWLRLGVGLFGWPLSVVFLPRARGVPMLWGMCLVYYVLLFGVQNAGVETVPPSHVIELALPLFWLTIRGASAAPRAPLGLGPPAAVVAVGVWASCFVEQPVMWGAISRSQDLVAAPLDAMAPLPTPNVAFVHQPFECQDNASWVMWRPVSSPDLDDPTVWVNHLDVARDRRLMRELFPARRGYVLVLDPDDCHVVVHGLDTVSADLPDGGWLRWARDPPAP